MNKITPGPTAAYQEYKPDLVTRLAQEKARRDQPAMMSLASKVPANYDAAKDRS